MNMMALRYKRSDQTPTDKTGGAGNKYRWSGYF